MTSSAPPPPPPSRKARAGASLALHTRDCEHYVELDAQGKLLAGHGQTEQLASMAAYASNVADVVGRMLQFGPSIAVEAKLQRTQLLVLRDDSGKILGLKPRDDLHLRRLRAHLKL